MTTNVWNLMYTLGNTERIVGDSENPQSRKSALDGAAVIEKKGWRVWVEHHVTGKRIYEGNREVEHREASEAKRIIAFAKNNVRGLSVSRNEEVARSHSIAARRAALEQTNQAVLAWWEGQRPLGWTLRQHLDNPTVNTTTAAEAKMAECVAAAVESGAI